MKEPVFVSAVVYARNDEATIVDYVSHLDSFLWDTFSGYEIIVVNDHSTDQTLSRLKTAARQMAGSLTILSLARGHGVELGMQAGLERSVGDFVFELESLSLEFTADLLMALYRKVGEGYDIVAASPSRTSWRSRLFYRLVNRVSYLELNLATETGRLVSRRALNAMLNLREKVRYRKALYAFTGYAQTQVVYEGTAGSKRQLNRENITLAWDILVSFSHFGLRLAHTLALFFVLFSVAMVVKVFIDYLTRDVVEGWPTIMIFLSIGFGGLFFILGLFGEYIVRILLEVQNRPSYTVASAVTFPAKGGALLDVAAGLEHTT